MFRRVFVSNLKLLLKTREMLFWLLAYPIVLCTLFYLSFANLVTARSFAKIDVALYGEANVPAFSQAVDQADSLFRTQSAPDEQTGQDWLDSGKVVCLISVYGPSDIKIFVKDNGTEQSVVKSFVDGFLFVSSAATQAGEAGAVDMSAVLEGLTNRREEIASNAANGRNNNDIVIYYYAVIGMMCFYFAMAGKNILDTTRPANSMPGRRVGISGCPRITLFAASALAHVLIVTVFAALVFCYMVFALHVDFGARIGYVLLTLLSGVLCGTSFGVLIGCFKSSKMQYGVIVGCTMLMSVLSGLCSTAIKYAIIRYAPFLRYLNPLGCITDCLYSLYYYTSLSDFWINFGLVVGYTVLFAGISALLLRRRGYGRI